MPESQDFALIFGHRETDEYFPTALVASQAGAWAAAHGEYRIAQQLMGLAAALEAYWLENTADVSSFAGISERIRNVPFKGQTRNEQPAYPLRPAAPADASTEVMPTIGSSAPRACSTCGLLVRWDRAIGDWVHSDPGTALEAAGAHEVTVQ